MAVERTAEIQASAGAIAAPDPSGDGAEAALRVDANGRLWGHAAAQTVSAADTYEDAASNQDLTILASAARTATVDSADQTNVNGRGLHVFVDVTAVTATPTITVKIQGKDAVSGTYYDLLEGTALTAVATQTLKVYPGLTAVLNEDENDILPRTWRIRVEHTDADSITYSVGASVIG